MCETERVRGDGNASERMYNFFFCQASEGEREEDDSACERERCDKVARRRASMKEKRRRESVRGGAEKT